MSKTDIKKYDNTAQKCQLAKIILRLKNEQHNKAETTREKTYFNSG